MTPEHMNKLEAVWKGEKCIICGFVLDSREFEEVTETPEGMCHRDCLDNNINENEI